MIGVDPWLHARELARLQHLSANAESTLQLDGLFELDSHRGGDADHYAAADVARLGPHDVAEGAEGGERSHDHLAGLRRGVELADDPDRSPGATRGQKLALEQEDVAHAERGQMEGDGGARDTAADDEDVGASVHLAAAAVTSAASTSSRRRTGSP